MHRRLRLGKGALLGRLRPTGRPVRTSVSSPPGAAAGDVRASLADARQDLLREPVLECLGLRLVAPHDELAEAHHRAPGPYGACLAASAVSWNLRLIR